MKFDIHHLFLAKYARWIIIGLITLFSLLIIVTYVRFIFFLSKEVPALNVSSKVQDKRHEDSVASLLNSSLFGVYVPNDLTDDNIKKSMLNVTLSGILLGNTKEESQVIIRSASGEDNTYKTGDKIPGGAIIKRIMPEGVLLEHDGVLESLSLPKDDLKFEPVAKPLIEDKS
jgi:general secretion pathway protein C